VTNPVADTQRKWPHCTEMYHKVTRVADDKRTELDHRGVFKSDSLRKEYPRDEGHV